MTRRIDPDLLVVLVAVAIIVLVSWLNNLAGR